MYKIEKIPLQYYYSKTVFGCFVQPLSLSLQLRTCEGNHWDAENQKYFPFKQVKEFRSYLGKKPEKQEEKH